MKKRIIYISLIVFSVLSLILAGLYIKNKIEEEAKLKNMNRYEEIKTDIDKELQRYMKLVSPNCQKGNGGQLITHKTLVNNAGMDKEKLLDVDNKSYCGVYVDTFCPEDGVNEWKIYISCNDYEDEGYKARDLKFSLK